MAMAQKTAKVREIQKWEVAQSCAQSNDAKAGLKSEKLERGKGGGRRFKMGCAVLA
jgi:hypothetical protein